MKLLPNSLFNRIALTFFCVIVVLAWLQFLLLKYYWFQAVLEKDQRMNWGLAESLAAELRAHLGGSPDEIHQQLYRLESLNSEIEIYVIDGSGRIRYTLREPVIGDLVNLEPIKEFLTLTVNRKLPLYGDDPSKVGRRRIFSAARIQLPEGTGYLYVLMRAKFTDVYEEGLENYYLVMGGFLTTSALIVTSALIGALLFRVITRRFRRLTAAVERIANGEFDERVPAPGEDEIGQLGQRINFMADTIVSSLKQVQETDALRRELVANVSHDIGGPLAALKGYVDLLAREKERLSEKGRSYVDTLGRNINTVLRLSEELLELSKLESNEIEVKREPLYLLDLVTEELIPKYQQSAHEKNVTLRAEHPEELPLTAGDMRMIERVLQNLIENAIRYNKPGGEVVVRLEDCSGRVRVAVRDTGYGIGKADLPHIFSRFYRGSQEGRPRQPGSGLGLAIVSQILKMHGEEIEVTSTVDAGTEFSFFLPAAAETSTAPN